MTAAVADLGGSDGWAPGVERLPRFTAARQEPAAGVGLPDDGAAAAAAASEAAAVDAEQAAIDADGALAVAMTGVHDLDQQIMAGEDVPEADYLRAQSRQQRARLVATGARERATSARQAADQAATAAALASVVDDARALAAGDTAREVEDLVADLDRTVTRLLELQNQHREQVRTVARRLADSGVAWEPAPSTADVAWHGLLVRGRIVTVEGFTVDGRTVDAGAIDGVISSTARKLGAGR